jgi:hypothetical protein
VPGLRVKDAIALSMCYATKRNGLAEDLKDLFAFPRAVVLDSPIMNGLFKVIVYEACPAFRGQPNDLATAILKREDMLPDHDVLVMGNIMLCQKLFQPLQGLDADPGLTAGGATLPPASVHATDMMSQEERAQEFDQGPIHVGPTAEADWVAFYPPLSAERATHPTVDIKPEEMHTDQLAFAFGDTDLTRDERRLIRNQVSSWGPRCMRRILDMFGGALVCPHPHYLVMPSFIRDPTTDTYFIGNAEIERKTWGTKSRRELVSRVLRLSKQTHDRPLTKEERAERDALHAACVKAEIGIATHLWPPVEGRDSISHGSHANPW